MFKLNYYIKRRPELSADEFRTFWLGEHASRNTAVIEELGVRQYLKCEALPDHPLTLASQEAYQTGPLCYDFIDHWVFNDIEELKAGVADEAVLTALRTIWRDEGNWIDFTQSHVSLTVDLAQFFPVDANEIRATPGSEYVKIYYPAFHYPHLSRAEAQLHWNACHGGESRQHIRYSKQKKYIQCHAIDATFVDWLEQHNGYATKPDFIGHAEGWIDPNFVPSKASADDAAAIVSMTMDDIDLFSDKRLGCVFMAQEHFYLDKTVITRQDPQDSRSAMPSFFSAVY